jgi:hypothetical protein
MKSCELKLNFQLVYSKQGLHLLVFVIMTAN